RFLVGWLAITAIAALWLPASIRPVAAWPAVTGAILGFIWYVAAIVGRRACSDALVCTPERSAATAVLALGFTVWSLPPAWSQGSEAGRVLILPGPPEAGLPNAPDRQDVVVSPELLKTLDG